MKKLLTVLFLLPILAMAQTGTPRSISYLESKFQTGDKPTQTDFYDLFASYLHYTAASGYQPLDGDLTSIAALSTFGIAVHSSANTWVTRSIQSGGGGITITNGDGIGGNISVASSLTRNRISFGSGSDLLTNSAKLKWYDGVSFLKAGNITSDSTHTYTIVLGDDITITAAQNWNQIFGDLLTLGAAMTNTLVAGTTFSTSGGGVRTCAILGQTTIQGAGVKDYMLCSGGGNVIDLSAGTSRGNSVIGYLCDITGTTFQGAQSFGYLASARGDGAFVHGYSSSASRKVIAAGLASVNLSANNASQQVNGGVNSDYAGIFAGLNSHIPDDSDYSVIIGGNGIKADSAKANQVYVPELNIETEPTNNDTINQVLVREYSTGRVHYRNSETLGTKTETISISSAEFLALNSSPKTLIPAPGSGKFIQIISISSSLDYNTTAYATNVSVFFRYGSGGPAINDASWNIAQTADEYFRFSLLSDETGTAISSFVNQPIVAEANTGDPTTGDGTGKVYIIYKVIDL